VGYLDVSSAIENATIRTKKQSTGPQAQAKIQRDVIKQLGIDLSGSLAANSQWKIYFTAPDAVNYWVDMETDGNSVVGYNYGTAANNLDTTVGLDCGYVRNRHPRPEHHFEVVAGWSRDRLIHSMAPSRLPRM